MSKDGFQLRFVDVHGARYVYLDDVEAFLRGLGNVEKADVRARLNAAADNFSATIRKTATDVP